MPNCLILFVSSAEGIKPITNFVKSVGKVLTWSNPTASFLIFLVSITCCNQLIYQLINYISFVARPDNYFNFFSYYGFKNSSLMGSLVALTFFCSVVGLHVFCVAWLSLVLDSFCGDLEALHELSPC